MSKATEASEAAEHLCSDISEPNGIAALLQLDPAAHAANSLLPFARVLEHLASASFVELIDAELLDFGNASETEFVLHERFNGEAVAVPTKTAGNSFPFIVQ